MLTADIKSKERDSSRATIRVLRYIVMKQNMPISYFTMIQRGETSLSQLRAVINALRAARRTSIDPDCRRLVTAFWVYLRFFLVSRLFRCIMRLAIRRAIYRLADISSGKRGAGVRARRFEAFFFFCLSARPRIISRHLSLRPLVNDEVGVQRDAPVHVHI